MEDFEIVQIFALIFWSFQLAPQAYKNWQAGSTQGLSALLMFFWTVGSLCTAIYCIAADFGPLFIIQPNLFMVFSIICWSQCIMNDYDKVTGLSVGICLTITIILIEALGGYYLKIASLSSNWALVLLASASTVFFSIGYIPQFVEIYNQRQVVGLSLLFLSIDIIGSILSVVSLGLQADFEPISGACYIVVFVCDCLIVLLSVCFPEIPVKENEQHSNYYSSDLSESDVIVQEV